MLIVMQSAQSWQVDGDKNLSFPVALVVTGSLAKELDVGQLLVLGASCVNDIQGILLVCISYYVRKIVV